MNIIECTIKMRREAQANYANLSKVVADSKLRQLFALLAAAEDEHIDKLRRIKAVMKVEGTAAARLSASVCVSSPQMAAGNLMKELGRDPDAYLHVLHDEEETIEFFESLEAQAEREGMKKIFHMLAEKEREQLAIIENIYSFMEEPRTYLEWGEFSNLRSL